MRSTWYPILPGFTVKEDGIEWVEERVNNPAGNTSSEEAMLTWLVLPTWTDVASMTGLSALYIYLTMYTIFHCLGNYYWYEIIYCNMAEVPQKCLMQSILEQAVEHRMNIQLSNIN